MVRGKVWPVEGYGASARTHRNETRVSPEAASSSANVPSAAEAGFHAGGYVRPESLRENSNRRDQDDQSVA